MVLRVRSIYFILVLFTFSGSSFANCYQDSTSNLTIKFDQLSYRWDQMSKDLGKYEGLSYYCTADSFRTEVISVLKEIHHYDTLIYNKLVELSYYDTDKEINKTLDQIRQFETEFNMNQFIKHLSTECKERRAVEKDRKNSIHNLGGESYAGQQLNVQNATSRYIKHVTSLVDHIRGHLHHLHIDETASLFNDY